MNVALPDGRVVEFPEGMSQEAISAELDKQFPAPAAASAAGAPLPVPARIPLGLSAAAASGLANTLALPGMIQENVIAPAATWMANKVGLPPSLAGPGTVIPLPTPGQVTSLTNRLGLSSNPALAPQSEPERLGQAAAAGIGASLPLLPMGGPLALLASGAAGGVAGEGARALGAPVPVQIAAGVAGGLGVQGLTSALSRGISHIASDLGSSTTLQEAGEAAQEAARRWLTRVPAGEAPVPGTLQAKLANAWSPVDVLVPGDLPGQLTNYRAALDSITSRAGGLASSEKALRPALPERLKELLEGTPGEVKIPPMARPGRVSGQAGIINPTAGPATPVASGNVMRPGLGPITWQDLSRFRSTLGDAMADPATVKAAGAENLSKLYAAVTNDMRELAGKVSPDALSAFEAANAESARLYGIAQGPVTKLVSGPRPSLVDDPTPGNAASKLLSGARKDGTDLAALRSEIPEAVDELAAAHLRLNPDARAWQRLSPEAQQVLVESPRDRGIISKTFQPKVPVRDQIERSILGTLLGESIPISLGLPPGLAYAASAFGGAAVPYVMQGARAAVRNPLLGIGAGLGAAANPAMSYRLAEPNPLSP